MKTYRVLSVAVAITSLVAVLALAQQPRPTTPSPGPDFVAVGEGWVHKDGVPRAPATPVLSPLDACIAAQPTGATSLDLLKACGQHLGPATLRGCEHLNPYAEPDRAADCSERALRANPPKVEIRSFTLGAVYSRPYAEKKILIIGKSLGLDGVEVVTAQVVHPESERGTPLAFVNDGGADAGQWWPALNGGGR